MPVPEESLVSLLRLRAGEEVEELLPPGEECPLVSLAQVAGQEVEGDHCLLTSLVSSTITTASQSAGASAPV